MVHSILMLLLFPFIPALLLLLLPPKGKSRSKLNLPPGPPPLPIIGNLHQLGRPVHRSLYLLSELYGPILHLNLGRFPLLVVSSPSLAELVLKTYDLTFCSRPPLVPSQEYSYNGSDVALSPYTDSWRNLRKILVMELLGPKKVPSQRPVREAETERMVRSMIKKCSAPVNLTEYVLTMIYNILSRVAFGREAEVEYGERGWFHEMIDEIPEIVGNFFVGDIFPGFGWIDELTGTKRMLKRSVRKMDAFYQEVIDEHMNEERKKKGGDREEDIVDILITMWRGEHIALENIKGALLNIFVAGTDTSAGTIIWAMAELARNPSVMNKAQDEIREVIGKKGKVEESDLSQFQYLKLVVNETLRLHPPAALLLPRESMQHCKINGYDICPKTRVFVNVWAIGRDKYAWENPEKFNPDRFIGSSVDYKGQCFKYLPFGGGRRMCPGMQMGIMMVELALANLLYAFNWELPLGMTKEDIDMSEALGVGTRKRTDLYLVAAKN